MSLSSGIHGVVIVHGIGDQRPGDTLADFSKALCDTLINCAVDSSNGRIPPVIQLKSDFSGSPPSVTMRITSPDGKEKTTWVCQEAYWNDAFPASPPTKVLWWGVNQNLGKQLGSLLMMLRDPANEKYPTEREQEKEAAKVKSGAKDSVSVRLTGSAKAPVVVNSGFISGLALVIITPLMYLLLGVIWLLHFVPSIGPLDKIIAWIRKLDPFVSSSLGDIERYIDHEIWSANARARVENVVIRMLQNEEIKDITIIAHSMGAVVVYDALTEGGNIAEAVLQLDETSRKKVTFVSVGGAINRVFDMIFSPDLPKPRHRTNGEIRYNDLQITRPLAKAITGFDEGKNATALQDKFYWLDIFARRDPIPAGPIGEKIIAKAGIDPVRQMKERRVVNKDSLVFDHVAYWENRELVMPRIIRSINGGTEYPWPEAGITEEKVLRRIKTASRYASLSKTTLFLVMLGLAVFAYLKFTGTI